MGTSVSQISATSAINSGVFDSDIVCSTLDLLTICSNLTLPSSSKNLMLSMYFIMPDVNYAALQSYSISDSASAPLLCSKLHVEFQL
jgi:hypothetical protein